MGPWEDAGSATGPGTRHPGTAPGRHRTAARHGHPPPRGPTGRPGHALSRSRLPHRSVRPARSRHRHVHAVRSGGDGRPLPHGRHRTPARRHRSPGSPRRLDSRDGRTLPAVRTRAAVARMLVTGFLLPFAAVAGPRLAGAAPDPQLLYILPRFPAYAPQTPEKRLSGTTPGNVPGPTASRSDHAGLTGPGTHICGLASSRRLPHGPQGIGGPPFVWAASCALRLHAPRPHQPLRDPARSRRKTLGEHSMLTKTVGTRSTGAPHRLCRMSPDRAPRDRRRRFRPTAKAPQQGGPQVPAPAGQAIRVPHPPPCPWYGRVCAILAASVFLRTAPTEPARRPGTFDRVRRTAARRVRLARHAGASVNT